MAGRMSRTGALIGLGREASWPEKGCEALLGQMTVTCANPRILSHFLAQFHTRCDAADSKSLERCHCRPAKCLLTFIFQHMHIKVGSSQVRSGEIGRASCRERVLS